MYCEICRELLEYDDCHSFSGYGFLVCYCEKHCPKEVDGSECRICDKDEDDITKV